MADELHAVFKKVKPLLKIYEPPLINRGDTEKKYELWSEKELMFAGKKRNEMFFASLVVQSNYVGFYFMPVYTHPEMKKLIKPELMKLLKGKSCFHLKKTNNELLQQIKDTLKSGFEMYKKNEWV